MKTKQTLFAVMLTAMPFVNPIPVSGMGGDPEPIPLKTTNDNHATTNGSLPLPKSPIVQPQIGIEDYTLYIYSGCEDATLVLVDENDNEVFSQEIEDDTDQIVLPTTLSGTYEIRIYRGNYMFYGEIEL